jgi:hypothetical protein
MMRLPIGPALAAALFATGVPAVAQDDCLDENRKPYDSERVHFDLTAEKREWILGEPCFLKLKVFNGDDHGIRLPMWEYDALELSAVDPSGAAAWFTFEVLGRSTSGPGWRPEVGAGETWVHPIPVNPDIRVTTPGTWRFKLRFPAASMGQPPWYRYLELEIPLRFRAPTDAEARALVEEHGGGGPTPNHPVFQGTPSEGHALAQPSFVPLLKEATRRGKWGALQALSILETREATRALVELLDPPDSSEAPLAAMALAERLPTIEDPKALGSRTYSFDLGIPAARARALADAWSPAFGPALRTWARQELSTGTDGTGAAARILEYQGLPEDLPALLACMDRDLSPSRGAWLDVCRALARRGAKLDGPPSTPGGWTFLACSLGLSGDRGSPAWVRSVREILGGTSAEARRAAVEAIPNPVPADLIPALERILRTREFGESVPVVATLATSAQIRALAPALLDALAAAEKAELVETLTEALEAVGDRSEHLLILARRIPDGGVGDSAFCALARTFAPGGNRAWGYEVGCIAKEAAALSKRWILFLESHRGDIDAGKLFQAGDGTVTGDLYPATFQYHNNGKKWPPDPEDGEAR